MNEVTIGGTKYPVGSFKFQELERAAPFIDKVQNAGILQTTGDTLRVATDTLSVVTVGILAAEDAGKNLVEDDTTYALRLNARVAQLKAQMSWSEIIALQPVFYDIMIDTGIFKPKDAAPGEDPAPVVEAGAAASLSETSSAESLQSSLPQAVPEETGIES